MSDNKEKAPYGKWESDISEETVVHESITLADVIVDPIRSTVYHLATRDDGTNAIIDTTTKKDVIGLAFDASSGVQGYGGAAAIAYDGVIYFSNGSDRRVYRVNRDSFVEAITPVNPNHYFANFAVYPKDPNFLVAVLEDHSYDTPKHVITTLCVINTASKLATPLSLDVVGADFYASPCFTPDGTKLAWQQWNFPDMPWEASKIYVSDFVTQSGTYVAVNATRIAGQTGAKKVSVTYPSWANNTTLVFTSDESNRFQNPWKYTVGGKAELAIDAAKARDFAFPAWQLGWSPYAFLDKEGNNALFMAYQEFPSGRSSLYNVDLKNKKITQLSTCPYADIVSMRQGSRDTPSVVFIGKKSDDVGGVTRCTLSSSTTAENPTFTTLVEDTTSAGQALVKKGYISPPIPIQFTNSSGQAVQAVYYKPHNPNYSGSSITNERPPVILGVHGGPTAMEPQNLVWEKQFYTSRGYAWLDVNYSGSSCFGKDYVSRLNGNWGVLDVQDCIDAIKELTSSTEYPIDSKRSFIRGRSSGGYATLSVMSTVKEEEDLKVFKAGSSYAGISDLVALVKTTHKFESDYMNGLVGGTIEDDLPKFQARSPSDQANRIEHPLLILQGLKDIVVPPSQAETIVNAIKKKHPTDYDKFVKYITYPDEGHHFEKAEDRVDAIKNELAWYHSKL